MRFLMLFILCTAGISYAQSQSSSQNKVNAILICDAFRANKQEISATQDQWVAINPTTYILKSESCRSYSDMGSNTYGRNRDALYDQSTYAFYQSALGYQLTIKLDIFKATQGSEVVIQSSRDSEDSDLRCRVQ